ncbi:MAG TPA: aminomethyl-transferring glycine dehydrogenase subunit GcvPA [Bacteroidaceae bacterium]|jgi:glycine dehydrogenase subunit 1|nr:aminomethyl-transferring glycine dehydrogenase subunit GcvPA [Bacteroidales bacterium]HOD67879.1 aminomethyl-transferring glycine dehydrogenase subunit GcvPA [Bacteroidaceae bacterium]HPB03384.1 aminomethyl-transferring glycine dehydrogenase subunit GcvPA [Bacteroidaceae bacterium]HPX99076.1 aminomethyl-transferring glycine dehydrogenase subunit GcvPA [Bacteroidaceae bacterium]HQL25415.1 aminomethyl-transferring glycine dehydrogenase subunit GcvPA [Bacteroidaceae bacterium]
MSSFHYFPHTSQDISAMLKRIGVNSIDNLYSDVPADYMYKGEYDLPEAMTEQEVRDFFEGLAAKNPKLKVFAGAGAYDHYTPAVISYITQRSEFLTAYTPYQCEISQGTLRYIFEYQSMICALTGMDVSNASMYDGPTAAAEAMRMCVAQTKKRNTILVSNTLLPQVRGVIATYAKYYGVTVKEIAREGGQTSKASLKTLIAQGDVAGAIVPSVNRFGIIEDLSGFADALHADKSLLTVYCDPSALAVLKTPAEWGADIAVGDAQPLGIPLSYGGPYLGFMACLKEHMRKLPGRIVGQTLDKEGRRAFVLTLQAREQHIRREKATSNICSNQSLMALWVTIYLSLMGPVGLKQVNDLSYRRAHYLQRRLLETGKFEAVFPDSPFIKEFVLKPLVPAADLQQKLADSGFFGALETEDGYVSFCATEKCSKADVDAFVNALI